MIFFQNSVLNKHIKTQDAAKVKAAYEKFKEYFNNPAIQENIRNSKEEQFQEGFLRELFVKIFGYVLNPDPNFNLTTELKNEKGAKKTDGAILKEGKALAVIELKGTDTKDLDKVNTQAFNYKNNQTGCIYVITSNFEKLRFFIHDSVTHLEFNLFKLKEEEFTLMWLCLASENLLSGIPLKIKEESVLAEENITKQLYKDYSAFKTALWQNLVKNQPKQDQLTLFKKTQKLLDRFLFIFFAEDSGLLPPNSISEIIKKWNEDSDWGDDKSLYDIYKQYFRFINIGRPPKGNRAEIFGYNGGLFAEDEVLDNVVIDDDILLFHTQKLTNYDFQSEVDVNILGHIFENSLNEIETITAQLEGQEIDKSKTKRKKDGVFYTPKYITKYIVDNTVGKLCEEKKVELGIIDGEYAKGRKNRKKDIVKKLDTNLKAYRDWLLEITICDPACGSGAFLNQALEFLIEEHAYIDELKAQLFGDAMVFQDVSNHILEKNIFGVDINDESVEIAKLSLWLRTAQRGRKLTSLNNNIKCGNSLIDDPEVAGEKAFNWQKEFPRIFENGGFDVVIGNPPYVRQELFTESKEYLKSNFNVYHGLADLYVYFFEKGMNLLSKNGMFSIIVANKWLRVTYGKSLREWLINENIEELIDFGDLPIFSDATAYPCIITLSNKKDSGSFYATLPGNLNFSNLDTLVKVEKFEVKKNFLDLEGWNLVDDRKSKLIEKVNKKGVSLHEYTGGIIRRGVVTGFNEAFVIDEETKNDLINKHKSSAELIKPFLAGKDVKKYRISFEDRYLIFTRRGVEIEKYPAILKYLSKFQQNLEPKPKDFKGKWLGRKSGKYKWYEIQDSTEYYLEFEKPKIIYPNICKGPEFTYDNEKYFSNQKCFIIPKDDKYLLGVLNSQLFNFLFKMILPKLRGGYFEPGYTYLRNFPLVPLMETDSSYKSIAEFVSQQIYLNKKLQKVISSLVGFIKVKLKTGLLSKNIQNWNDLELSDFLNELNKAIKKSGGEKLSKMDEMDWMDVFESKKSEAQELKSEINRINTEIDQMVYLLYGLTDEEIKIVEES